MEDYESWSDRELVEELCEIESGLSDWEVEFVESIAGDVFRGKDLSEKRRKKAVEILERRDAR